MKTFPPELLAERISNLEWAAAVLLREAIRDADADKNSGRLEDLKDALELLAVNAREHVLSKS